MVRTILNSLAVLTAAGAIPAGVARADSSAAIEIGGILDKTCTVSQGYPAQSDRVLPRRGEDYGLLARGGGDDDDDDDHDGATPHDRHVVTVSCNYTGSAKVYVYKRSNGRLLYVVVVDITANEPESHELPRRHGWLDFQVFPL